VSRRMPTIPDTEKVCLTAQQELAVDLLATGKTITEAANALGVTRQTVSEWRNQNPVFEAALNERREELWSGMSDRLRALLPKVIGVLEQAVERGDLRVAVAVLRAAGLHGLSAPDGPVTVEDAETGLRVREAKRRNRALFASLG
jgi:transposase-like protein